MMGFFKHAAQKTGQALSNYFSGTAVERADLRIFEAEDKLHSEGKVPDKSEDYMRLVNDRRKLSHTMDFPAR